MNWFFSNNEWTNEWINEGKNEGINVNKIGSQNTCHLKRVNSNQGRAYKGATATHSAHDNN